jgi:hypothetical protein
LDRLSRNRFVGVVRFVVSPAGPSLSRGRRLAG